MCLFLLNKCPLFKTKDPCQTAPYWCGGEKIPRRFPNPLGPVKPSDLMASVHVQHIPPVINHFLSDFSRLVLQNYISLLDFCGKVAHYISEKGELGELYRNAGMSVEALLGLLWELGVKRELTMLEFLGAKVQNIFCKQIRF